METLELKNTVTKILTDGFYNRMQIIEENVSKSVDKSIEIIQQKEKKTKSNKQKNPEQVLRIPWEYTKKSNTRVNRVPEGEEKEHVLKKMSEKTMTKSFETW